jgi:hypothetical protein
MNICHFLTYMNKDLSQKGKQKALSMGRALFITSLLQPRATNLYLHPYSGAAEPLSAGPVKGVLCPLHLWFLDFIFG